MIARDFPPPFQFATVSLMEPKTFVVNKDELPALVEELLRLAKNKPISGAVVVALHGDLGAGKTTLVQALGKLLGITETITSPTFTIMKGYETTDEVFTHLIHMDAYRIDDIAELGPLRFEEILTTPNTLFCIEWAEKITSALPPGVINLTLEIADENSRTVQLSHRGTL